MSRQKSPDFNELVGAEVAPRERERLRAAHDLLVQAGPPAELSPELEQVPWPAEALAPLGLSRLTRRRRPWLQVAMAAAALLFVGFLIGQSFNSKRGTSFSVAATVKMHGTANAPNALASIALGKPDADGNWPMLITVTNLPRAQGGGYYDLWLSRNGKPVALCGTFNTKSAGDTIVRMSTAYDLQWHRFGWVVIRHLGSNPERRALVMTT